MQYVPINLSKQYNLPVSAPPGQDSTAIIQGFDASHGFGEMREILTDLMHMGKHNVIIDLSHCPPETKRITMAYLEGLVVTPGFNAMYTGVSEREAATGFGNLDQVFNGKIEPTIDHAVRRIELRSD